MCNRSFTWRFRSVFSLAALGQFEPNSWVVSHVHLGARELVIVAWILKLEVEFLGQVYHEDLHVGLGEGFSKADTVASMEKNPAHRMTLFTVGCQAEWAAVVKPLW